MIRIGHHRHKLMDRIGMGLSVLCAIHCLILPFFVVSLPLLAQSLMDNEVFHIGMAVFVIPVGLYAFWLGYRHHHKKSIVAVGCLGLLLVGVVPILVHELNWPIPEVLFVSLGSVLLIGAHWFNRQACSNCQHHHQH